MKKFLSMLLVAVMALSTMVMMTGCGGSSEEIRSMLKQILAAGGENR